ncbi:MAG: OmpH family outer membrane protein [Prevotella sp.]
MEIKKFVRSFSVMSMALAVLSACNQAESKMDEEPASTATETSAGMKIAYVEVDSLMSQYNFCKEYSLILQKKSNNARNTLNQKGAQLQKAAANFQEKLQSNGFTSREEAERVQMALQRQQQDLQELQNRLGSELDSETAKFNEALRDSLQNFLKVYNKSKKYDLILSKAGDNILYAAKKYDITQDVINGLNKRYKSTIKKEAEKK